MISTRFFGGIFGVDISRDVAPARFTKNCDATIAAAALVVRLMKSRRGIPAEPVTGDLASMLMVIQD
jgi:hypothetical protein